ncbi:hypothetical protein [Lacrimispora brassicae]
MILKKVLKTKKRTFGEFINLGRRRDRYRGWRRHSIEAIGEEPVEMISLILYKY